MNALVMYDRQSGSLWSQFLSRAVRGKHTGRSLEPIPLLLTTWESWKAEFPDSRVLDKRGRYEYDSYSGYYESGQSGVIGRRNRDERLPVKELVLGTGFDGGPKAYPHSSLARQPIVNDTVAGTPAVIWFDPSTATATAFSRQLGGTVLTFDPALREPGPAWLRDRETGTTWSPLTGQAVDGELVGSQLTRIHAMNAFWFAWTDFYPDTEIFGG